MASSSRSRHYREATSISRAGYNSSSGLHSCGLQLRQSKPARRCLRSQHRPTHLFSRTAFSLALLAISHFKIQRPAFSVILSPLSTLFTESLPARQSYLFKSKLGEAYPSDLAIAEVIVGRRREPPSQTILPFQVPCSARLTRPTRQLLKPPSDVGESLPARQTHPFRLLASQYRTCRTLCALPFRQSYLSVHHRRGSTIRLTSIDLTSDDARASRLDNLTFSSYVSEANPSNRWARPPVGWRLSIPTKLYLSSSPVRHSESWSPVGRRWEHSRPDNLAFSSPTLATLTRPT